MSYLLAEEFDRDPFLIFRMRGMDRGEFLTLLGEGSAPRSSSAPSFRRSRCLPIPRRSGQWASCLKTSALPLPCSEPAPRSRRDFGKFPFWRGQGVLLDFLDRVYMETAAEDQGDSCSDKIWTGDHLMQRRELLKSAAGLTILRSGTLRGQNAPSNKLNVALIGVWGRGTAHYNVLRDENVVALCDVNDLRTKEALQIFPKAKTYWDWRRLPRPEGR